MEGTRVNAGAALNLALLARKVALAGLEGLEWAVGIPGTLGGALVMNAGAHGGELKDVVESVSLVLDGKAEEWSAADCGFAYRHSRFKDLEPGRAVLTGARLLLRPGDAALLKARMEEVLAKRRATQPVDLPNAGCVFKNPEGESAGRLIEQAGLKGRRRGGARISERHANFVVNEGGARAADVLALMEEARAAVKAACGIDLENEILILGVDA
jgi:UDP-N-acetylmuramate dehydrogenase